MLTFAGMLLFALVAYVSYCGLEYVFMGIETGKMPAWTPLQWLKMSTGNAIQKIRIGMGILPTWPQSKWFEPYPYPEKN